MIPVAQLRQWVLEDWEAARAAPQMRPGVVSSAAGRFLNWLSLVTFQKPARLAHTRRQQARAQQAQAHAMALAQRDQDRQAAEVRRQQHKADREYARQVMGEWRQACRYARMQHTLPPPPPDIKQLLSERRSGANRPVPDDTEQQFPEGGDRDQ